MCVCVCVGGELLKKVARKDSCTGGFDEDIFHSVVCLSA